MNHKLIGGTLLIVGTSIGGAMLALPIATAAAGLLNSLVLLLLCWAMMTFSALLILEVNLWLPEDSNMISMAKQTLGKTGNITAWLTYILLLYSLLCAYIASGTDVTNDLLNIIHFNTPMWLDSVLVTLFLGYIVYLGIKAVDYANRILMLAKFVAYFLLIILILPHVQLHKLTRGNSTYLLSAVTVVITSFGFATIIPSVRVYLNSDARKLRFAVILGSLIPLICYTLWLLAILGTVPSAGKQGLIHMLISGRSTSELTHALNQQLQTGAITELSRLFTSICVGTSFLGVSLCLMDFLSDGLKIRKNHASGRCKIAGLTFLPPLVLVLFFPKVFIISLSYAGIFCVILLMLLPALMAWRGRYHLNMTGDYRVIGGKPALTLVIILAAIVVAIGIAQDLHWLPMPSIPPE